MCVLSIKVPIRKKSANLFNDPRMLFKIIYIGIVQPRIVSELKIVEGTELSVNIR